MTSPTRRRTGPTSNCDDRRIAVEETLDRLPEKFTRQLYAQKCDSVYQHVFDSYWDDGHSLYDLAA
jgi:type I restriction enzyme R subunit